MTEEVAVVKEEAVAVEIEEVVEVVQEVAVDKAEEVADPAVVVEVAVVEELVAEEEDKLEITTKIRNKKLVTRNFIRCYNRKDRNTGKCRRAV